MLSQFEFAVIGGGIAGLSVAAGLAPHGRVVLLEKEARLAGHASGRSVAMYSTHSGNAITRALTRASRSFLEQPPSGWRAGPPLTPRGMLVIAPPDQLGSLQAQFRDGAAEGQPWRELDGTGAAELTPILEASRIAAALYEPGARQMEVDRILAGYRHMLEASGGVVMPSYDATRLSRRDGLWRIVTRGQTVSASIVVNAAGAWADEVARRADLPPLGMEARRRTVAVVSAPLGIRLDGPMTADAARNFYVRPAPSIDGTELFMSPCDEAPLLPGDAQPQAADLDLVRARLSEVCRTEAGIAYAPVRRAWAGLRSFAPDELPVVGFDPLGEAFFWVAGQGGHGLQAAPGIAELAVTLVLGEAIGGRLLDEGVQVGPLSVRRSAHSSAKASRVST